MSLAAATRAQTVAENGFVWGTPKTQTAAYRAATRGRSLRAEARHGIHAHRAPGWGKTSRQRSNEQQRAGDAE
jgi:hypothetical protein